MALLERLADARARQPALLITTRLVLRALARADAPRIAALANDRGVAEMTARVPHPYAQADADAFLDAALSSQTETTFAVTRDRTLIGLCGMDEQAGRPAEIGYWFGRPYWGQGFATEAAKAVIDHAFADPRRDVLVAGARVINPASRRVLEKCGFEWTGVALIRCRALACSVPADRFRLERARWRAVQDDIGDAHPLAAE